MCEYQFYIFELVFRKNAEAFREYYNRIFQPPDMGVCGNELLDRCVAKCRRHSSGWHCAVSMLLMLAAEADRMEDFDRICRRYGPLDPVWPIDHPQGYPIRKIAEEPVLQMLEKLFLRDSPFVVRKPEFFERLWETGKPFSRNPTAVRYCCLDGRCYFTNLPDLYLAVISGDTMVASLLLERCKPEEYDFRMDECDLSPERADPLWMYVWEPGYFLADVGEPLYFHDLFTAAIFSGKIEMIQMMGKRCAEIRWNHSMEAVLAMTQPATVSFLLEEYPEILNYIRLSAICRERNTVLLRAWSDVCSEQEAYFDELEAWIRVAGENAFRYSKEKQFVHPSEWWTQKEFYSILLSLTGRKKIRQAVGEAILYFLFLDQLGNRSVISEEQMELLNFLFEQYGREKIDGTGDICGRRIYRYFRVLNRLRKISGENLVKIDQYEWKFEDGAAKRWVRVWLELICPVSRQNRTDEISCEILRQNEFSLFEKSVRNGYIGRENALPLYEYAMRLPRMDERILQGLLMLAAGEELQEIQEEQE